MTLPGSALPWTSFPWTMKGSVWWVSGIRSDSPRTPSWCPPHAFFILSLMDGETTVKVIREAFNAQFGQTLAEAQIHELVKVLDGKGFMDTPSFRA